MTKSPVNLQCQVAKKDTKIDNEFENALNQIHEKRYYDKYLAKDNITLLPVAYSENDVKCDFIDINMDEI